MAIQPLCSSEHKYDGQDILWSAENHSIKKNIRVRRHGKCVHLRKLKWKYELTACTEKLVLSYARILKYPSAFTVNFCNILYVADEIIMNKD